MQSGTITLKITDDHGVGRVVFTATDDETGKSRSAVVPPEWHGQVLAGLMAFMDSGLRRGVLSA